MYNVSDNSKTTLTNVGGINGSDTSITVANGSKFPTSNFIITVWNGQDPSLDSNMEKMLVTSRSSNTLTVGTRGFGGTSAASHAQGDYIGLLMNKDIITDLYDNGTTWYTATVDITINNSYGYIANKSSLLTLTLPTTATVGTRIRIVGIGAGGWKLAQNASQQVHFGNLDTTSGIAGYLSSNLRRDCVELICVVANTEWNVISSVGNINVV